ncbi:SDR family oxidoreductase [Streptomyces sp. NPDC059479]|uniref:SDR family oxidoreductase n=1 Tax=Streptomyces sp. NPDC059479 TaxID=3346848 RepID=UPI003690B00D
MGSGGRIINIGSCLATHVPSPGLTSYAMSKAAITGLTLGMARDLGPRGITVNQVAPGSIDTDMNPADGPGADYQRSQNVFNRYGTADEIASSTMSACWNSSLPSVSSTPKSSTWPPRTPPTPSG